MDDITIIPKAKISRAEVERRRKAVRRADANNRIEGIYRSGESDKVFDAFIRGEIEAPEIIIRLNAQPSPR